MPGRSLLLRLAASLVGAGLLASCAREPMPTVAQVDIDRFMGPWYVLANIPTFMEKGAHNAVESYELDGDGSIATTFTFRKDGFDGEQVVYQPRGFVRDPANAIWGMQFVWPIEAEYRIVYLDEAYTQTVIGRSKRDYVWIMARTPEIAPADYDRLVQFVGSLGYDVTKLEPVPQRW